MTDTRELRTIADSLQRDHPILAMKLRNIAHDYEQHRAQVSHLLLAGETPPLPAGPLTQHLQNLGALIAWLARSQDPTAGDPRNTVEAGLHHIRQIAAYTAEGDTGRAALADRLAPLIQTAIDTAPVDHIVTKQTAGVLVAHIVRTIEAGQEVAP